MEKKTKGYKKFLSRLMPYVKPHRVTFFLSVVFDLIAILLNMLIPICTGKAIDCMITAGEVDFRMLTIMCVTIFVLTAVNSLFDWLGSVYMNKLTYLTAQSIRNSIYSKLNSVPIKFIDNNSHGDIMNTMVVDVENVTDGFLEGFKAIMCGIFQVIIVLIMMLVLN